MKMMKVFAIHQYLRRCSQYITESIVSKLIFLILIYNFYWKILWQSNATCWWHFLLKLSDKQSKNIFSFAVLLIFIYLFFRFHCLFLQLQWRKNKTIKFIKYNFLKFFLLEVINEISHDQINKIKIQPNKKIL